MQFIEGIKGIIGMKKIRAVLTVMLTVMLTVFSVMAVSTNSSAAEFAVEFGSNWYDKNSGDEFSVCAYLRSDVALTGYTLEIEYDRSRLKYVSGATTADEYEGILVCSATGDHMLDIKVWLTFDAISGGEGYINIIAAKAVDEDGVEYTIESLDEAPVHLKGEDIAETNLSELEAVHTEESDDAENAEAATDDVENIEAVDGDGDESQDTAGSDSVDASEIGEVGAPEIDVDAAGDLAPGASDAVVDGTNNSSDGIAILQNTKNAALYYWLIVAAIIIILVTIVIVSTNSGKKRLARKREQLEMVDIEDGYADEFEFDTYDENDSYDDENVNENVNENVDETSETYEDDVDAENSMDAEKLSKETSDDDLETVVETDKSSEKDTEAKGSEERITEKKKSSPVGTVANSQHESLFMAENVTIARKVVANKASGVGEFIADKISEKPEYEYVNILEDITVNIRRGEIVEITGQGKRDLEAFIGLIIGKCKPTEGTVDSKLKRFRIVTARSCFDLELSGRANIYRSGALMGHPKAVLDKCYNRIVKFAGADGLMEAPAKNLSMSTINKLEVALALLDDQADMIILGNVLGDCDDNFIRKCNSVLSKMADKNMTVLLIGQIPEEIAVNCSRTIRIENGHIIKA